MTNRDKENQKKYILEKIIELTNIKQMYEDTAVELSFPNRTDSFWILQKETTRRYKIFNNYLGRFTDKKEYKLPNKLGFEEHIFEAMSKTIKDIEKSISDLEIELLEFNSKPKN